MGTTYRLIGTGVDVFMDTDAANNAKEFLITDIRGLDSADIRNGFEVGIEQYSEGQLAAFAMEKSIELYSFDEARKERCVVRQLAGNPAGRFNGSSSNLLFSPGFNLASSGALQFPIVIKMTLRFSEQDLITMADEGNDYFICTTDLNDDDSLEVVVQADDESTLNFTSSCTFGAASTFSTVTIDNPAERCLEMIITYDGQAGTELTQEFSVAGESEMMEVSDNNPNTAMDQFDFVFGAALDNANTSDYYLGIMRTIVVSAAGTELINTIDPSTGVNSAGTNGVATDITSVTTITS